MQFDDYDKLLCIVVASHLHNPLNNVQLVSYCRISLSLHNSDWFVSSASRLFGHNILEDPNVINLLSPPHSLETGSLNM
jgi:hypothetical protein